MAVGHVHDPFCMIIKTNYINNHNSNNTNDNDNNYDNNESYAIHDVKEDSLSIG